MAGAEGARVARGARRRGGRLKLEALGLRIDTLTPAQAAFLQRGRRSNRLRRLRSSSVGCAERETNTVHGCAGVARLEEAEHNDAARVRVPRLHRGALVRSRERSKHRVARVDVREVALDNLRLVPPRIGAEIAPHRVDGLVPRSEQELRGAPAVLVRERRPSEVDAQELALLGQPLRERLQQDPGDRGVALDQRLEVPGRQAPTEQVGLGGDRRGARRLCK